MHHESIAAHEKFVADSLRIERAWRAGEIESLMKQLLAEAEAEYGGTTDSSSGDSDPQ